MSALHQTPDGVYLLNSAVKPAHLFEVVNACLAKAHALVEILAAADIEAYSTEIIHNYLWALSDIVHEAKWLHDKMTGRDIRPTSG